MKFGPCLRNSVVSKKWPTHCARRQTFLPVPYFIPPQESRAKTEQQDDTYYNCHQQSHWCSHSKSYPQRLQKEGTASSVVVTKRVHTNTHIYRPLELGYHLHIRIRINHKDKKPALYNMVVASLILCLVIKI